MTTPEIPQSLALAEATADSLSELLSRDPEDPKLDRQKLIAALRAQRERWQLAEQAGKPSKAKAASRGAKEILQAPSNINPDDIGL